jgi:hypothetical protein
MNSFTYDSIDTFPALRLVRFRITMIAVGGSRYDRADPGAL